MQKENEDFTSVVGTTLVNNGAVRKLQDYAVSIRMAEHLAMMSKTNKGHEVREYFIQVEKDFNSPEKIMVRALLMADKKINKLEAQIEADRPKVLFADAVSASKSSCLIGELAKILKQKRKPRLKVEVTVREFNRNDAKYSNNYITTYL